MTADYGFPGLLIALEAAVPLEIASVRNWSLEHRQIAAAEAGDAISGHGDALMFGSGKRGETAGVFTQLARGLAIGACNPGGVTFAGMHWCAWSHPHCPNSRRRPECCTCDAACTGCRACRWCRNGCAAASGQECCQGFSHARSAEGELRPVRDVPVAGDVL